MPLKAAGRKVLKNMTAQYGAKKGKAIFYASINKGILSARKMHRAKKK
jgi:hypothetical protein